MYNQIKNIVKVADLIRTLVFYKRDLSKIFKMPVKEIDYLFAEIYSSSFFKGIRERVHIPPGRYYLTMFNPVRAPLLYVACRILKPQAVVETGVKEGFSSSFILAALEMNKQGRLYSIDLPNRPGQELKENESTGWLVPEKFKARWNLIFGSSRDKLPGLLEGLRKIDIFFHDSDHSYKNMMFEFNLAWEHIRPDGYLISDDVTENKAFTDFVKLKGCKSFFTLFRSGIAAR